MAQENKMGIMPTGRLLWSMSVPVMLSMLVSALYNIVDSMFIARISDDALTAVSLCFPVQLLMIALATGIGVGLNVLLSQALGAGNRTSADRIAGNGIFLSLVCWGVFAVAGWFGSTPFLTLFTQKAAILSMGTDYLRICTAFSCGVFLLFTAERLMQATGQTVYHMIIQCIGALINVVLDPILIFGLFGAPVLGVAGAAIATILGQCTAMAIGFVLNYKLNQDIHFSAAALRPDPEIVRSMCRIGLPAAAVQALSTAMTAGMNAILMPLSLPAVGFFGVYYKLQNFLYMPLYGLTNTMVPIIGYNLGAKKYDRIRSVTRNAIVFALAMMGVGALLFLLFPHALLSLFGEEGLRFAGGVTAIRIIAPSFLPAAVTLTLCGVLQGLGRSGTALLAAALRQLVLLLPAAYLLGLLGFPALWLAFPVSEILTLPAAWLLSRQVLRPISAL
ncbi:MAG: MATE family efflux transporter [Butyricicoccus sp.]|nr:MATE family efflux transporter [Butyricicoccus sp.]